MTNNEALTDLLASYNATDIRPAITRNRRVMSFTMADDDVLRFMTDALVGSGFGFPIVFSTVDLDANRYGLEITP